MRRIGGYKGRPAWRCGHCHRTVTDGEVSNHRPNCVAQPPVPWRVPEPARAPRRVPTSCDGRVSSAREQPTPLAGLALGCRRCRLRRCWRVSRDELRATIEAERAAARTERRAA